jgi:hypothetical protein
MNEATYVFIGEVLDVKETGIPLQQNKVTFKVYKYLKGEYLKENRVSDTMDVLVPCLDGRCCGISFSAHDRYTVYVSRSEAGKLYTSACSETEKMP